MGVEAVAGTRVLSAMEASLIVLGGVEPTKYVLQPGQPFTIGRHRTNTLVVHDEHCSRQHAEVFEDNGVWILRDIHSQNGSYVDGKRVDQAALQHGQELRFGSLRLRFELPPVNGEADSGGESELDSTPRPDSAIALLDQTTFQADQLSALCRFMAETVHEVDASKMVRRALELVLDVVQADIVGFLGLDDTGRLVPQLVLPTGTEVDQHLSRRLTDEVQRRRRSVWMNEERESLSSDSLVSFDDAICVPMPGTKSCLGALHVYRRNRSFLPQDPKFCEIVARHLADSLRLQRTQKHLESENARLRQHVPMADRIVGSSPALQELRRTIE
jgi:Nif-specific regulatory protein